MAAFALGLIGDQSAVEPLRAAVADPLPLVAGRAAEALGLLNDAASAPVIGKMVASHAAAAAAVAPDDARAEVESGGGRVQAGRVRAGAAEKLRRACRVGARARRAAARAMVAGRLRAAAHRRQARAAGTADARASREPPTPGRLPSKGLGGLRDRLGGSRAAAADRAVARDERDRPSKRFARMGRIGDAARRAGADETALHARPQSDGARGDAARAGGLRRRRQRRRVRRFPGRSAADRAGSRRCRGSRSATTTRS